MVCLPQHHLHPAARKCLISQIVEVSYVQGQHSARLRAAVCLCLPCCLYIHIYIHTHTHTHHTHTTHTHTHPASHAAGPAGHTTKLQQQKKSATKKSEGMRHMRRVPRVILSKFQQHQNLKSQYPAIIYSKCKKQNAYFSEFTKTSVKSRASTA